MRTWQARPTTYRGIQMRSRLEAKYAAIFDDIGLRWEYEPRAFGGRGGQYLPDFVIFDGPLPPMYVEVKPTLEMAQLVLPRMQVIWESDPTAMLAVFCDVGGYYAEAGGPWTWHIQ